ncbi:NUMOD4 motif-containing HNH endonuclease [Gordonia malaquae]|uniref:NUMOD4 motif-containing HNH endonuclease n=1 Tax=Gordonia malaquae TaxID=410332 RepID=UPI0030FE3FB1
MTSVAQQSAEEWRPIVGLEGTHEVSSLGRVRSLDHTVVSKAGRVIRRRSRIYKLTPNIFGYPQANLAMKKYLVHHLVAEAFIGPRPDGMSVCHQDDVKDNNRASNLHYGTTSENIRDCVRNGHHTNANKTHCPLGHEYAGANVIVSRRGNGRTFRQCRICRRLAQRKCSAQRKDQVA